MNIFNADLTKLVSQSFLEDEKAKQICEVINTELQSLMANVHFAESAYDIDNATEAVLEHIAWQLNSELFFLGSTLEEKKRLVKEAIKLHRRKGTKYAVEHAIQLIIPTATVSEWFEYDGNPYHFRVLNADRRTLKEILIIISLINIMKSLRSWIDNEFIAIDEGLIDLNLLLDMDILMTSKHDLDYIRGMSFLYPTVYNEFEIIDSEEVLYNELNLEIAKDLLQQFLTDNNLSQESFNTLANFYKEQEPPNTVINPNSPDPRKILGAINARNDYEALFTNWLIDNPTEEKETYQDFITNFFYEFLNTWQTNYVYN